MATATRKRDSAIRTRLLIGKVLLVLVLLVVAVIMVMPFYWMLLTSFKTRFEVFKYPIQWLPAVWHFENYPQALAEGGFPRYFFNSAFVATVNVLARMFFAALTGYALAKYHYPLLKLVIVFIIATMMIPWDVTLVPVYLTMRSFGWIDTYWALIAADLMTPFGIFLMRQICLDIPDELIAAARVDGCSEFGIWRRIVLPNVSAGLITLAIFDFLGVWNAFYWPLLVISSENLRTVPLALSLFSSHRGAQPQYLMAVSTLMTLPTVLIFVLLQRYYMASLMASGLKM
ncbi:MAG: carbohydrate ABC transporter permease [Anaerolineae bacterium]